MNFSKMKYIYIIILLQILFSCSDNNETRVIEYGKEKKGFIIPNRYEKLVANNQIKYLIDSTLAVIQNVNFTKDTTFGNSTGDKQGKVDVEINYLDSIGCFASVYISDTSELSYVYIFKIDKPN